MRHKKQIFKLLLFLFLFLPLSLSAQPPRISLEEVLNKWAPASPAARQVKLAYENTILQFANYRKGFLPSIAFSLNPVSFNHSQKLMQNYENGDYTYVEDYSNSSSAEVAIRQKVGWLGGELSVSSRLNYLREFSNNRNRFGTNPVYVSYSQPFVGGFYNYKKQQGIEYARFNNSVRRYCSEMAEIQSQAVALFMNLFAGKLAVELSGKNLAISDSLVATSRMLMESGRLTEYDFHQMELQQLNNRYALENSTKEYRKALRELCTFLDKDDWEEANNPQIATPSFDLPLKIDEVAAVGYARRNSPFALEQEEKRLKAEQTLFTEKLNNRFNGSISLSYGLNQYADRLTDAYRHPDYTQGVMIGVQIPIFQWGMNRNKIRIAQNNYQSTLIEIEQAEAGFDNDIKDIVADYNHNMNLWFVASKSYQLAQEQYVMLAQKFRSGKVSVYELTSAQQGQYDAMQRYYNALRNAWSSFCTLRKSTLYDFAEQKELEELLVMP